MNKPTHKKAKDNHKNPYMLVFLLNSLFII